jgi:hypothetical protein
MIDYDVFTKPVIKNVSVRDKKVFLVNTPLTGKIPTWVYPVKLRDK